ncbi:MAG: hypothetical protein Unbinned1520contig1002_44 [Prokaryotic dsDNA virus sp.]|nr:MAG: hypothetical protein Unbinned1520contig1002_44 [Prokaryotic dsDNA virus sp.]|tara:strand:+ start:11689 stop:12069 length:381 start_codon:yes stop_codon:yes gene_type:complete
MKTPALTFFSKVTDEFGGEFPLAFVSVRKWSESSQTSGESIDGRADYAVESDVEAIAYKVSYWYTPETEAAGKRSRPLLIDKNGTFTDVLNVDMEDAEVVAILAGDSDHVSKILLAIKADITRKFN